MIPVDVAINLTLAAGWYTAVHRWEGLLTLPGSGIYCLHQDFKGNQKLTENLCKSLVESFSGSWFLPQVGKD